MPHRHVQVTADLLRHKAGNELMHMRDVFSCNVGPMATIAAALPKGEHIRAHRHDWAQLVFSINGVMSVNTDEGYWVVPPGRAVWIPPLKKHSFQISTALEVHTLYIDPSILHDSQQQCCVLQASALLLELVDRLLDYPVDYGIDSPQSHLVAVILDEIQSTPSTSLHVPWPSHAKLLALARHLTANPADNRTLEEWGTLLGASQRTLARLFRQNTGVSFAQWRQQLRLVMSLQLLAESKPVTLVASQLGYESTSAFISMFRKNFGTTPSKYFCK